MSPADARDAGIPHLSIDVPFTVTPNREVVGAPRADATFLTGVYTTLCVMRLCEGRIHVGGAYPIHPRKARSSSA